MSQECAWADGQSVQPVAAVFPIEPAWGDGQSGGDTVSPNVSLSNSAAVCWGESAPDYTEALASWDVWQEPAAAAVTVQGDADWGRVEVEDGTPITSPVIDMGDADEKTITAQVDKYETGGGGTGVVKVWVRGSDVSFGRDD